MSLNRRQTRFCRETKIHSWQQQQRKRPTTAPTTEKILITVRSRDRLTTVKTETGSLLPNHETDSLLKAETDTVLSKTETYSQQYGKQESRCCQKPTHCFQTLAHCGHTDSLLSETDSQLQKMRLSVVGHRDKLTVVRRKRDRLTRCS